MRPYILTSSFVPNDDLINTLFKGPNFCLPNNQSFNNYINHINEFIRKLQWNLVLKKNTLDNRNRFGLKKSERWVSDKLISKNIKHLCDKLFNSCFEILKSNFIKSSVNEKHSFNDVKFCTADKGSNWVIMSQSSYIQEGLKQLNNPEFYTNTLNLKCNNNLSAINHLISYLFSKKYINLNEKRFLLTDKNFIQRSFYLLPKIHKTEWSVPNYQPKGRPIVNCKLSETHKIAIFIDHFLQPIVQQSNSYIKDSFNFISKIKNLHVNNTDIF